MKNNFKPNEFTNDLKSAIEVLGGQKVVSERFKIPYRTVQNWARGVRHPPEYVARLLIDHAQEKVIHESCMNDSYALYVEDQEALERYEAELKKEKERVKELTERNYSLANLLGKMNDLAIENRKEIESNEEAIDQLEMALDAARKELTKYKKASEYWSDRANRNSKW